jgi:hypothetical protein
MEVDTAIRCLSVAEGKEDRGGELNGNDKKNSRKRRKRQKRADRSVYAMPSARTGQLRDSK